LWRRLGGGTIAALAMSLLLALVLVTIGGLPDQIRTRLHGLASHQMAGVVTTDKGFLFSSPFSKILIDQNLPPSPKRQPFGGKSVGTSLGHTQWTTLADCEVYAQSVRALFFQKFRSPLGVEAGGEDQCWAYALGKESGKCDPVNCWQAGTSKATSWSGGDVGLPIKVVGSADKVPPIAWTDVDACEAYATSNDAWYFQHADTNCYVCECYIFAATRACLLDVSLSYIEKSRSSFCSNLTSPCTGCAASGVTQMERSNGFQPPEVRPRLGRAFAALSAGWPAVRQSVVGMV
jgi:hypothetical protein